MLGYILWKPKFVLWIWGWSFVEKYTADYAGFHQPIRSSSGTCLPGTQLPILQKICAVKKQSCPLHSTATSQHTRPLPGLGRVRCVHDPFLQHALLQPWPQFYLLWKGSDICLQVQLASPLKTQEPRYWAPGCISSGQSLWGCVVLAEAGIILLVGAASNPKGDFGNLRMLLCDLGWFGPPEDHLQARLDCAYEDFCRWKQDMGIQSSQPRFRVHKASCIQVSLYPFYVQAIWHHLFWSSSQPHKVVHEQHGNYFVTKAYDARVVLQWVSDICNRACQQTIPHNGRTIGKWLSEQVASGQQVWPQDDRLALQHVAAIFGFTKICFIYPLITV